MISKLICKVCEISFVKEHTPLRIPVTCSKKCRNILGGRAAINKNRPRGENHIKWKGGKENRISYMNNYKETFPERVKARAIVYTSLRKKRILRQPCEVCGNIKSEAHHEDYSRPLFIRWLCRMHHREADKAIGLGSKDF